MKRIKRREKKEQEEGKEKKSKDVRCQFCGVRWSYDRSWQCGTIYSIYIICWWQCGLCLGYLTVVWLT